MVDVCVIVGVLVTDGVTVGIFEGVAEIMDGFGVTEII